MQPTVYHVSSTVSVQAGAPGTTYPGGPLYGATASDSLTVALNYAAEIPTRSVMQYVIKFAPQLQAHGYTADDLILDVAPSTSTTSATISLLASASHPADAVLIANDVAGGFSDYIRVQNQQQLDAQRTSLTNQINSIKQQKASWEAKITTLPNNTVPQYTVYNNNLVDTTHMLDTLVTQLQTLPVTVNSNVTLIQPAAPKDVTTSPKGLLVAAVSGGVGLLIGILIVSLLISLGHRLRSYEQINEKLGLAYLGSVSRSKELQKAPKAPLRGAIAHELSDVCANLRLTGILPGVWQAPHGAVLLVTSAQAAEGKTTLAAAMATQVASTGGRVVVVDANLQQPSTHLAFRMSSAGIGLSGLLKGSGNEPIDDVVMRSTTPGVWLLPAGAPAEGAILLLGQRFSGVVKQLRQKADLVIIDGPPLLTGASASQLANMVDGVALVVDVRYAKLSLMMRTKNLLLSLAHVPVGIIMNQSDKQGRNSYYAAAYSDNAAAAQGVSGQVQASNGANNGYKREPEIAASMAINPPFMPANAPQTPAAGLPLPGYPMSSAPGMPLEPSNTVRDLKSQQTASPLFRSPPVKGE